MTPVSYSPRFSPLIQAGAPFELIEQEGLRRFKHAPQSLVHMLHRAKPEALGQTFVEWLDQSMTFGAFFQEAERVAGWMLDRGLERGDRVCIAMRNRPEWLVAAWATLIAGGVSAPLNSWGRREELEHSLAVAKPKFVFVDHPRCALVSAGAQSLKADVVLVSQVIGREGGCEMGTYPVHQYSDIVATPRDWTAPTLHPSDQAVLLFTSGTTSKPKAAVSTHDAVVQSLINIQLNAAVSGMTSPEQVKAIMSSGFPPAALVAVPFFHVSGFHALFLFGLASLRKLVLAWKWDIQEIVQLLETKHVTQINGSPAMMRELLASSAFRNANRSSLGALGLGGAAAPAMLIEEMRALLPLGMMGIGYGATETNGLGAQTSGQPFLDRPHASGYVSPLAEIRVRDLDGALLPHGATGEIEIRSSANMVGYWDADAGCPMPLEGHWYATGDVGFVDEDGYLHIVDRVKDIVNRGGEKVSCAEVEAALLSLPGVRDAVVMPLPDMERGEIVSAVVVLDQPASASSDALRDLLIKRLAHYKVPERWVLTDQAVERTPSGKPIKSLLKPLFGLNG
jgi:long-chain acyl-CoA synthetase